MHALPAYQSVRQELSKWQDAGLKARFWLRDDDAIAPTAALKQLGDIARDRALSIGLAVIPGRVTNELRSLIAEGPTPFEVMCHGWMHVNHGTPGNPHEFGDARGIEQLASDARHAKAAFESAFGISAPYFVPPFAQISRRFAERLQALGFRGLSNEPSRLWQRLAKKPHVLAALPSNPVGALSVNTGLSAHLDPVDWRRGTSRPHEFIANRLLGELLLRRKRVVSVNAPIGVLTHHLAHDDAIWTTMQQLLDELLQHPAVAFPALPALMAEYAFNPTPPSTVTVAAPAIGARQS